MRALHFQEAVRINWSPRLMAQMVIRPVYVGDRRIARRQVFSALAATVHAWWYWTTALPGDTFEDFVRDQVVQVVGGAGAARKVKIVDRRSYLHRHVAAFDFTPPEPSRYAWYELDRIA